MAKISQRSPSQHQDPAPLNNQQATVLDTLCQTTSKKGTQPHPLAERLPKIIITSQTPRNTTPHADMPTRKTISSFIHQNTGTSRLHQEAYTTHWTSFSHWWEDKKNNGNYEPTACEKETQNTESEAKWEDRETHNRWRSKAKKHQTKQMKRK